MSAFLEAQAHQNKKSGCPKAKPINSSIPRAFEVVVLLGWGQIRYVEYTLKAWCRSVKCFLQQVFVFTDDGDGAGVIFGGEQLIFQNFRSMWSAP
jgi:hypothetical protein